MNLANEHIKQIGINIKQARLAKNITQQSLAKQLDIDKSYLCKVENGLVNPSILHLIKVAKGLDISLINLFKGIND